MDNTTNLIENLSKRLTSLESNRVIRQLNLKINSLQKENDALKKQIKNSERELVNISQKEKKCQEELTGLSKQKKKKDLKSAERQIKEKIEVSGGNRGFLIKGGKTLNTPN